MPGTTVFAFAASGDCRKPTRSSVLLRSGESRCEVRSCRVELDASMEACDKSGCLRTMLACDFRQNKVNFVFKAWDTIQGTSFVGIHIQVGLQ
jgi:hypothetical protein